MPNILELLLQQQPTGNNRNQPIYAPLDQSLIQSLIAQTANAQQNSQNQASKGQAWIDAHDIPAAELMRGSMNDVSNIQGYQARAAEMAKPNGFIGNALKQVVGGIASGAAQGLHNKVQNRIDPETKPNDNSLITSLLGTPTQQGTGEWHAPLMQGETLPNTGTGLAGGKISPMTAGLAMMTGQDPNTRQTGGNIVQQFLTPRESKSPSLHSMGVPGMEGYKQNFYLDANNNPVVVGEPWKVASGVTVNMGDQQHISPATPEQKQAFGLSPQIPAVYDRKTGEVKPINVPQGPKPTEDQQKTGMYLNGMTDSYHRIERALELYGDLSKPQTVDRLGAAIGSTAIPDSVAGQFSKNMKSEKWQAIEQANAEFGNYALKTLTGASQTESEARETVKSMLPALGDPPNVQASKRAARQTVIKAAGARAAPQAPQAPINPLDFKRAGKSYQEYLNAVRGR